MQATASAVKRLALARGIEVFQPPSFRDPKDVERVRMLQPDALVVAAYGLLLPAPFLDAGRYGAVNIHASLLPRWRGAAPIQRALLAGDRETGISIMQMDAGLDTGPVLAQRALAISEDDDSGSLHERLADLGAEMIVAALGRHLRWRARRAAPAAGRRYVRAQDREARKRARLDAAGGRARARGARVPARCLERARGCTGETIKIWRARCN